LREQDGFSRPTGLDLQYALGYDLVPVVDVARDIPVELGLRPYEIHLVRTQWTSGDSRGNGVEQVLADVCLLPIPKLISLDGVTLVMNPGGLDELGTVRVLDISGRYSEQFLRGLDEELNPPSSNSQFFYEILFPTLGQIQDTGIRRRFTLVGAPNWNAENVCWELTLVRTRGDRTYAGALQP
jgi:hypothetical protein